MTRKTNKEICAEFRTLLTEKFHVNEAELTKKLPPRTMALAATKEWRNELWKAFREIEDRLCPLDAMSRKREMLHRQLRGEKNDEI